jgi:hypothetical protein
MSCIAIANVLNGSIDVRGQHPAEENPTPVGTRLPMPASVAFDHSRLTVLVVLASDCEYCEASLSLYQRIGAMRRAGRIQVVGVGPETSEELRDYLKRSAVDVDAVVQLDPTIPAKGTPTIMLVDRQGIVRRSWLGCLSPTQERRLVQEVDRLATE